MCQATGQGYNREQDKHKHPDVELTNIKLPKRGLLKELTGVHCAGSNSPGSRAGMMGRPGQEGSQYGVQTLS